MKIYTKDSLIAELIKIREKGWIQTRRIAASELISGVLMYNT